MFRIANMITILILAVCCSFSANAFGQWSSSGESDYYINKTGENVHVYTRGVYPGAQRKYSKTLRPDEGHSVPRYLTGSGTHFYTASDDKVAKVEKRRDARGQYFALIKSPSLAPDPAVQKDKILYINQSGEDIHVYSTVVYPGAKRKYVKTLRPGEATTRVRGHVGTSLSFHIASDDSPALREERRDYRGAYVALIKKANDARGTNPISPVIEPSPWKFDPPAIKMPTIPAPTFPEINMPPMPDYRQPIGPAFPFGGGL